MMFSKGSWFYSVYCWSRGLAPVGVNLCPFMRHVFVWAPLKWLFVRGGWPLWKIPVLWYLPWVEDWRVVPTIVWPWLVWELPRWAGVFSYKLAMFVWAIYFSVACLALAMTLAVGICYCFSEEEGLGWGIPVANALAKPFKGETAKLISAWVKSVHDRVCPWIEFR